MMFWAPCDSRPISDQLLMVLIVNKQANSDSQQMWDLPRDEWAAVFSFFARGWCSMARTDTCAQLERWRGTGELTWAVLTKTCHHPTLHSHNQQGCQLTAWHTMTCACVCVSHTPSTWELHYGGAYPACSTPLWETEIQYVCCAVLCCAVLLNSVSLPQTVRWSAGRTIEVTVIVCWRKRWEDDGKRWRQREWKWGRRRQSDRWRWIDKELHRGTGRELSRQGDSAAESFLSLVLEHGRHWWDRRGRDVKGTQHQTFKRLPCQALL